LFPICKLEDWENRIKPTLNECFDEKINKKEEEEEENYGS